MSETTQAVGAPLDRQVSRWWRRVLRTVIDLTALYCAWAIQFAASGSYAAATITAVAVGLYGLWCFYDGSA
jgi:hypothetical protein